MVICPFLFISLAGGLLIKFFERTSFFIHFFSIFLFSISLIYSHIFISFGSESEVTIGFRFILLLLLKMRDEI